MLWDRPFVIGDLVEIDGVYGEVKQITLRTTRLVTVDGKMLAIPHAKVANTTVASYTNAPHLRLDVPVCVGVTEDLERARRLLLDVVASDDRYRTTPPPVVVVKALHDYNLELELRAWLADERQHIPARVELRACLRDAALRRGRHAVRDRPSTRPHHSDRVKRLVTHRQNPDFVVATGEPTPRWRSSRERVTPSFSDR